MSQVWRKLTLISFRMYDDLVVCGTGDLDLVWELLERTRFSSSLFSWRMILNFCLVYSILFGNTNCIQNFSCSLMPLYAFVVIVQMLYVLACILYCGHSPHS